MMSHEPKNLLAQVSRSFYLTIRVLPASIRPQIGLAYLLARATDTIADTRLVSVQRRLAALRAMEAAILAAAEGTAAMLPDFGELAAAQAGQGSSAERTLLESVGKALEALRGFDGADRSRIREALDTITRGQEMDLMRFGSASAQHIVALDKEVDLEEYTYCVAGCAGEFWTKMCRAHLFPAANLDDAFLMDAGVRFGRGLQLVNILRDLPEDLRQGRCYMPREQLAEFDLQPRDLLDSGSMSRFRPLCDRYLRQAEDHLAAGWAYVRMLPRGQPRVRLACAWPILIGVRTAARLLADNVLDGHQRIKVSRSEVRRWIMRSVLRYPWPPAWDRLFDLAKHSPP